MIFRYQLSVPAFLLPLAVGAACVADPSFLAAGRSDPGAASPAIEEESGVQPWDPKALKNLGFQPPEVLDVRMRDTLVHQDTEGGAAQELLVAAGAPGGGFGVIWRDPRDGLLGLYLRRIGPDGAPLEAEQPFYTPHTSRRLDPALVVRRDGSGVAGWTSVIGGGHAPWMRCFDAEGKLIGSEAVAYEPIERGGGGSNGRDNNINNARTPFLAESPDGGYVMCWTLGDRLQMAEFGLRGERKGQPRNISGEGMSAEASARMCFGKDGALLFVWRAKQNNYASLRTKSGLNFVAIGAGALQGLEPDPRGGYWALFAVADKPVLRHLSANGTVDRPELELRSEACAGMQLAVHAGGLAFLWMPGSGAGGAEPAARGKEPARGARTAGAVVTGVVQLQLLDADAHASEPAFSVPSADAREPKDARLASNGERLFVAWTDSRTGNPDVFGRTVDPRAETAQRLGEERRLNSDVASTDQINPAVAASGDLGVIAWHDKRNPPGRIYVRRANTEGLVGDEVALPVLSAGALPAGGSERPAAAMRTDGSFLVAWKQNDRPRSAVLAQAFDVDAKPVSGLIEIDADPDDIGLSPPAVCALPGERGYLVAWTRPKQKGVFVRRLSPTGELEGTVRQVSSEDKVDSVDPALCVLDDGKLLCAWGIHAGDKKETGWSLRARSLDAEGVPRADEMRFEASRLNEDWDPALAPAQGGGFVMSWSSGEPTQPARDVAVRLFDEKGRARGPILTPCYYANEQDFTDVARLQDGSFIVSWEDDVSYYDQPYLRRLLPNGRDLGPIRRVSELDTKFVTDRQYARIAALGDGLLIAWNDRRRSLGLDVYVKIVGKRLDAASK